MWDSQGMLHDLCNIDITEFVYDMSEMSVTDHQFLKLVTKITVA